jgi:LAS superfamily LD-carboxypeptidase LdcB
MDSDEISGVIRALREADLRLEELTAGEVDTVAGRDGHAFLLQRAQNQLRQVEAAKQQAGGYLKRLAGLRGRARHEWTNRVGERIVDPNG